MLKIGSKVKLKNNVIVGRKYGGLTLERKHMFDGVLTVEWLNNEGLIKLSNGRYYTRNMLFEV